MPPEHLHRFFEAVRHYGYAAVFVLIFVENIGIPVPGETIFIAALLMVTRGELSIVPAILCAWSASVLGGMAGFAIGRFGGHKVLERYGGYVGMNTVRLQKVEGFFGRYGAWVVLLGRFFDVVRQLYAVLAGCVSPSWRRFFLLNLVGATLWVGSWATIVLWLGKHLRQIWEQFKIHQVPTLLVVSFVAALSAVIMAVYRKRRALLRGTLPTAGINAPD